MKEDKKNIYDKVSPSQDFVDQENAILQFWQDNNIFFESIKQRVDAPEFSFYDGPPTANGKPHIGHVLTRVIKDIIPRYKTMKGYKVQRKAGWDTHGLPVELEVEKALGLDGKGDIEKYGVEKFVQKCKESVFRYKLDWEKMSQRVGFWVDMNTPYITYDDSYIESVWWSLKEIYNKGLLYKGHKILPYCARCGTSLSSHEVAQGYKDVTDRTAVVGFELDSGEYIAAWTTTPWTLPSNVALCVHPEYEYVLVSVGDKNVWVAKQLADKHFDNATPIKTLKGIELKGKQYKPLYPYDQKEKAHYVVCDKFVVLDTGTGVVHIAPAYGEDDARVGTQNNLPFVQKVGADGVFVDGQFGGVKFRDADKLVLKDLKTRGLLIKELAYTHSYPHCWRCDQALMYYARSSWFVAMSKVRDKLIANNNTVKWHPESIGAGRFGNFLGHVIDWGISRERYWGTPLPIWQCECGHTKVIGSKIELVELGKCDPNIELHKPFVDKITIPCDKCASPMQRTLEVIDCWYDSGSMPFAQYNYPHSATADFKRTFPADFISEAVDQTRGWFYTLMALGTVLFDTAPFKNCIVLGHVLDKQGIKMSKHKGNVVDPWTVLDSQGADAVRWYFLSNSAPWLPSRFDASLVSESSRKFIGTLWNVYSFFVLYANIDSFDPMTYTLSYNSLGLMDKWILSCLNSLVSSVESNLDAYRLLEATKQLGAFCDQLSNWYIRRCRQRYWGKDWTQDKQNAYETLYTVLHTLTRLIAPFVPFVAESIWQNIVCRIDNSASKSVHLSDYPIANSKHIDTNLQNTMQTVLDIVECGRAARSQASIKNRQPLSKAFVGGIEVKLNQELVDIIKEELNVKQIQLVDTSADFLTYECKPQLRTLGARYGAKLGVVKQYLIDNSNSVAKFFDSTPDAILIDNIAGTKIELKKEDVLINAVSAKGYACGSIKSIVVALDTTLTSSLVEEGFVRELVSKLQNIRKESNYEVTDRIKITYKASDKLSSVITKNQQSIMQDTLCDSMTQDDNTQGNTLDINGESATVSMSTTQK